jgi:hypothetical protein
VIFFCLPKTLFVSVWRSRNFVFFLVSSSFTRFPKCLLLPHLLLLLLVTFCSPVRALVKVTLVSLSFSDFDNIGVDVEARFQHQTRSVTKFPMLLYVRAISDVREMMIKFSSTLASSMPAWRRTPFPK